MSRLTRLIHERRWRARQKLIDEMNAMKWVHQIDLGDGIVTPGAWGRGNPEIWRALADVDFADRKVLDIGCWDGLYSFEAERRGAAEVWAADLQSQRDFVFQTLPFAKRALKSSVRYEPNLSVYDIERLGVCDFDVVIFAGVYYHLKDPLRALAALRNVMKDGATILVEGAISEAPGCFAQFFYDDVFCEDRSNWWVPTVDCLRQWVGCSYFQISQEYGRWGYLANQRHVLLARAVSRMDSGYVRPDADLRSHNKIA